MEEVDDSPPAGEGQPPGGGASHSSRARHAWAAIARPDERSAPLPPAPAADSGTGGD